MHNAGTVQCDHLKLRQKILGARVPLKLLRVIDSLIIIIQKVLKKLRSKMIGFVVLKGGWSELESGIQKMQIGIAHNC